MVSNNLNEAPTGEVNEDSYVSRQGQKNQSIPVQSDKDIIEDPLVGNQDTDEQLGKPFYKYTTKTVIKCAILIPYLARDDNEAIDKNNIIDDRTRNAAKPKGTYREPGDTEGIPDDDGTSANRQ